MKRLLCALFGHRPRIRWWFHSPVRTRGLQASCECDRCGAEIARPSAAPIMPRR